MVALVNMLLAGCSVPASGPVGPIELVDSGMDTDVAGSEDTGASSSAGVVSVTVSSPGLELFFPPSGWTDLEAIDVRGRVDGDVQYVLVESAVDSRLVFPDADRRFVAAGVELGAGLSIDLTIEAVGVLGFTAEEHVRLQRGVGPPPGWQVSGLAFDRSGERLLVWDTDEPGGLASLALGTGDVATPLDLWSGSYPAWGMGYDPANDELLFGVGPLAFEVVDLQTGASRLEQHTISEYGLWPEYGSFGLHTDGERIWAIQNYWNNNLLPTRCDRWSGACEAFDISAFDMSGHPTSGLAILDSSAVRIIDPYTFDIVASTNLLATENVVQLTFVDESRLVVVGAWDDVWLLSTEAVGIQASYPLGCGVPILRVGDILRGPRGVAFGVLVPDSGTAGNEHIFALDAPTGQCVRISH